MFIYKCNTKYAIILSFSISSACLTRLNIFFSKKTPELQLKILIEMKTKAICTPNLMNCLLIFILITFLTQSGVLNVSLIVEIEISELRALTSANIVNKDDSIWEHGKYLHENWTGIKVSPTTIVHIKMGFVKAI